MNLNYSQQNPKRLHSPLLDGNNKIQDINDLKGKRTYYNPSEENNKNKIIDETLENTLFKSNAKPILIPESKNTNYRFIDSLELFSKVANIFIVASGGILSLLEFVNIAKVIYDGTYNFGNSIIVFTIAFIGTILSSVVCMGFAHLIKTTKYIYLNSEIQNKKIEALIGHFQ